MKTEVQAKNAKKVWSRPQITSLSVGMTQTGNGNGDECLKPNKNTQITCSLG